MLRRLALPLAVATAACVSEPGAPSQRPDAATTTDAATRDAGVPSDSGTPDAGLPAVVTSTDPMALEATEWTVGIVPAGVDDWVAAALDDGTFSFQFQGTDDHGVTWRPVTPDDNGRLGDFGQQVGYAQLELNEASPRRLVARVDRGLQIYLNGRRQPGDIYGSGRMRVPLVTRAGYNLIVIRAFRQPSVGLAVTPDELHINPRDLTLPDLVTGDSGELWIGAAVLNLSERPIFDLVARVEGNQAFESTAVVHPAIAAGAVTQVAFRLQPARPFPHRRQTESLDIDLVLESHELSNGYRRRITRTITTTGTTYRRTFRSPVDGSVQYYAVVPPRDFDPQRRYAMVLSLHGAAVEALGQARSYAAKDWAYVVAPTNRRPFGFDWEEWGRFNALASLDHAMASFRLDPTQVYLTGHSMGGHGTWHVGVTTPGRFAVLGPSAGWSSFQTYTGRAMPSGPFGRARAHSTTNDYLENLEQRAVYIIHGSADDNVPVREGRDMFRLVSMVTDDVDYHEQPGAGHWWNGPRSAGVDCGDWPPLFDLMQRRRLDPLEAGFTFRSPAPSYSPRHSFVSIESANTPYEDVAVTSTRSGDRVVLTTENVRSLSVDGSALESIGVRSVEVDGDVQTVVTGALEFGPRTGKRPHVQGPYNQVYRRPFCFVYRDDDGAMADYAAYLTSYWSIIGNGAACALPVSRLTDAIRADRNLIHLGHLPAGVDGVSFDGDTITLGDHSFTDAAMMTVFPEGDRLGAALFTTDAKAYLLYRIVPFSSGAGLPDYLIFADRGGQAAGYFDPEWRYDPALGVP